MTVPDPLGIAPRLYTLLGQAVTRWSYVEAEMNNLLAYLLHADAGSMYVVTQSVAAATVSNWTRVMSEVHFRNHPYIVEDLHKLLAEIDEIRAERNTYVHGIWSAESEDAALVMTMRWERSEVSKDELVTEADLTSLLERTTEVYEALVRFGVQIGYRPAVRVG